MNRVIKTAAKTMRQDFNEWCEKYLASVLFGIVLASTVISTIVGWVFLMMDLSYLGGWTRFAIFLGGLAVITIEMTGAIWGANAYNRAKKIVEKENDEMMRSLKGNNRKNNLRNSDWRG